MSLDPGINIGSYAIERELGRGGMGVVYLGHDSTLDRAVAIKALAPDVTNDPARMARFETEARTLAQLNHPNVAGIYGVEEHDGQRYLILEYVEGELLEQMLERGPLPVHDAIEIAVQIAAGVEAAHDAGVIHRDLKPANVIVTPDGVAKVLDFGLARIDESSSSSISAISDSPTLTSPARHSPTMPGVILGTAAYMSPEQARGRRVDKRTDIWSFGVVLYEMLVGMSPFVGETVTDSIGAILHKDIDLDRLPAMTPANVRRVLARCVERDKNLRYRDIGDVRVELLREHDEPEAAPARANHRRMEFVAVAILLILVTVAVWFGAKATVAPTVAPVRKFDVMTGTTEEPLKVDSVRISPDGARLAFIQDQLIHIRDLSSFKSRPLSGTDGARSLFWSPDSKWIGYLTSKDVYKVGLVGGGSVKVASVGSDLSSRSEGGWTADDRIVFAASEDLVAVDARGGEPNVLIEHNPEKEIDFHECSVVSGTNIVLFIEHRLDGDYAVAAWDGHERVVLTVSDNQPLLRPSYSPSGHVIFARGLPDFGLWAVGFDPTSMTVTSDPFLVLPEAGDASVSKDGTLAVYRGTFGMSGQLVWASPAGIEPIGDPFELAMQPLLSPDGTKIAVSTGVMSDMDVWVCDLERGSRSRITFLECLVRAVGWSPDGREIAVGVFDATAEPKLTTRFYAVDGSGETREMIEGIVASIDANWRYAIIQEGSNLRNPIVSYLELDNPTQRTEFFNSEFINGAVLNPVGTLAAFVSRESGEAEIYCTRFPEGVGRWQISTDGGSRPQWSADGATLYFHGDEDGISAVDVATDPSVQFGMPRLVLDVEELDLDLRAGWSIDAEGKRFVALLADSDDEDPGAVSIIENWYEEFKVGR